ncbi:MAG: penicillin-binding protein 2 [Patescibacteria group bacterium]|nr:penicillin-binding protein 2 [Patescibacteria group bacterium]
MSDYSTTIERRLTSMGVIVVIAALVILWRMFDIQILQHSHYIALALGQQRFEKTEIAQRGKVYVHDSSVDPKSYYPLAFDVKKFSVWVVPKNVTDKVEASKQLSVLLGIPELEIFNKINNDKLYIPPLKKGLVLDEANNIKNKKIAGVFVMPEYSRYYPEGTLASQVLGFVNSEGDGKYGFEGHYNNELKGMAGDVKGEKDTLGRMINLLEQNAPQDGTSYVLTVDRSLQYYVEKKLNEAIQTFQADSGSIVIMDIETGGIIAMASAPTYDPNNFQSYAKDNQGIYVNPVIAHLYEPGSILKPLVMSAAIDSGAIAADTTSDFDWHVFVGGFEIKTAEKKAFGHENMTQVLQNSDNVAMVWISEKMGKDNLYKYLNAYNLLDKTNIDLDTESAGYTPPFKHWRDINRATIAFGQGISVTPIEIVSAYAAMANKGVYIYPHIVDKIISPDGSEKKIEKQTGERVIKPETAQALAEMMFNVVENGHSWRAKVPGFKIGAKTGTAQIPKPEGGYEESEDGLGIFVHSLAGFAPTDDPKYAMLVKLDRPKTNKYAENTAAPVFGDISNYLLNYYYRLKPTRPIP